MTQPVEGPELKRTVLIVDDSEIFRERMARAFVARGFEVRTAADAQEARGMVVEESPEWAILDLRMPGDSGLQLLQDIIVMDPTVEVVILTGYGSIATTIDAMRLGAISYVAKPADVDEIIAAFERGQSPPLTPIEPAYQPLSLARVEWEHINRVLSDCGGNISQAARLLGIHRRSLQRKLKKFPPSS